MSLKSRTGLLILINQVLLCVECAVPTLPNEYLNQILFLWALEAWLTGFYFLITQFSVLCIRAGVIHCDT